jgi:hypothetical protein
MMQFCVDNLKIDVEQEGARQVVTWTGESDATRPEQNLGPVLLKLMTRLQGTLVELRFSKLTYMNSASVTPIMAFVRDLSAVAKHIRVSYRADLQWQNTSFRAMRVVARKWANVEVVGEKRGPDS